MSRVPFTGVTLALVTLCWGSLHAQDFVYASDPLTIEYDVATGVGSGTMRITNQEILLPGAPPFNVGGWALAFTIESPDLTVVSVEQGLYIQTVNNGGPPDFWTVGMCDDGIGMSAVYSLLGGAVCTYEVAKEIVLVEIETIPGAWAGNMAGASATINSSSPSCLSPPVENVVVVNGASNPPTWSFGALTMQPIVVTQFLRGDSNNDGVVQAVPDAIALLNSLFSPTGMLACRSAGDVNDDGEVNIGDAIGLLEWGFSSGPLPPEPFPVCGTETTSDALDCLMSAC